MLAPTSSATLVPNHHADHPGHSGILGLLAATSFMIGRRAEADLAIELTGVGRRDDVVDVGCGPGVAVRRAAAAGASSVVGIDPAAAMLRMARLASRAPTAHAAAVRYVVLGTVLIEPLILALRRVAEQEASARRFA